MNVVEPSKLRAILIKSGRVGFTALVCRDRMGDFGAGLVGFEG